MALDAHAASKGRVDAAKGCGKFEFGVAVVTELAYALFQAGFVGFGVVLVVAVETLPFGKRFVLYWIGKSCHFGMATAAFPAAAGVGFYYFFIP